MVGIRVTNPPKGATVGWGNLRNKNPTNGGYYPIGSDAKSAKKSPKLRHWITNPPRGAAIGCDNLGLGLPTTPVLLPH